MLPSNIETTTTSNTDDNNDSAFADGFNQNFDEMEFQDAIRTMEESGTCLHPEHLHSFQVVNFLVGTNYSCCICHERIPSVVLRLFPRIYSNDNNDNDNHHGTDTSKQQLLKCIACGIVVHRTCAASPTTVWKTKCPVNLKVLKTICSGTKEKRSLTTTTTTELVASAGTDCSSPDDEQEEDNNDECIVFEGEIETNIANESELSSSLGTAIHETVGPANVLNQESSPFASVARALQENVLLARFRNNASRNEDDPPATTGTNNFGMSHPSKSSAAMVNERNNQLRVAASVVAGGIAGGVAGLALAGPAGAILSGYVCATGMVVEGTVATASVVVASIAAGTTTSRHLQSQQNNNRVISVGEMGAKSKVLLVRPSIHMDPIWDQIALEGRKSAPLTILGKPRNDSDIVTTREDEIATKDKVLFLVSRALNDKFCLSGHMYRYLVEVFRDRCRTRTQLLSASNPSIAAFSPRARRDDAHAVIKYVTAVLLEERPELGSSPFLTEMTANIVESLVFGQIYDAVFEEIRLETQERDESLRGKIEALKRENNNDLRAALGEGCFISEKALKQLQMIPEAHSASDKLYFCVRFLDVLAGLFSNVRENNKMLMDADSLVKMAWHHLLLSEMKHCCAEVVFLEEFARDEQLLRGRHGYALATLQASLQYLAMTENPLLDHHDG